MHFDSLPWPWQGQELHTSYTHFTTRNLHNHSKDWNEDRVIETSRESIINQPCFLSLFVVVETSTSEYWIRFLVILKAYQFIVSNKCVWRKSTTQQLKMNPDQLTSHFFGSKQAWDIIIILVENRATLLYSTRYFFTMWRPPADPEFGLLAPTSTFYNLKLAQV